MGQIVRGMHLFEQIPVELELSGGYIERIDPLSGHPDPEKLPYLAPGLVDLQVNGYGGIDLNALPLTDEKLSAFVNKMWRVGVTAIYPTVITHSPEAIGYLLRQISSVQDWDRPEFRETLKGVHLEGPFISPEDGPRGAHPQPFVQAPDISLMQNWQSECAGMIRIVTLSPHWDLSEQFIEWCTARGILVSIGHTSASPEQIAKAVEAGAGMSTHLGNGAHAVLPRHPNYIWEQLAQDRLWASMIADGFHLPDSVLKVMIRLKQDKAILVSDSTSLGGMPPGQYTSPIGGDVTLTAEGRLHMEKHPNLLAGSAQPLLHGIHHLVHSGISTLQEAWKMASMNPSKRMGLNTQSGLDVGAPADLVLFSSEDQGITVSQTWKSGRLVYDIGERK